MKEFTKYLKKPNHVLTHTSIAYDKETVLNLAESAIGWCWNPYYILLVIFKLERVRHSFKPGCIETIIFTFHIILAACFLLWIELFGGVVWLLQHGIN